MSAPLAPQRIFDELRALELSEGFEFEPQSRCLSIVTEPVVLESLALGSFKLMLDLTPLFDGRADGSAFSVEALQPNPAHRDESIVHPHVKDQSPCLGEATVPIQAALRQGRVADAFELLERVLQTYNPASPYCSIDDWTAAACEDCGDHVAEDSMYACSRCGRSICSDCERSCDGCEDGFCAGCLDRSVGEQRLICANCQGSCANCDGVELLRILEEGDGLCESCSEAAADAEQEEEPDDAASDAAGDVGASAASVK